MEISILKYEKGKPLMHGASVVRLQELLNGLDIPVKVDGVFGTNTHLAVSIAQEKLGLKDDGICGPLTWKALIGEVIEQDPLLVIGRHACHDIRKLHARPRLYAGSRSASSIIGVVLHQTGCDMPSDPKRWGNLNAHIGITQEGKAIIVNDPEDFIWHAQGLSHNNIGIEIEGNFHGVTGDDKTLWKGGGGPHFLNARMMDAFDSVIYWIEDWAKKNNVIMRDVYAHRQSFNSRIADPGEEIWTRMGKLLMDRWNSHVDDILPFKLGTGRSIPREWDDRSSSRYWQ